MYRREKYKKEQSVIDLNKEFLMVGAKILLGSLVVYCNFFTRFEDFHVNDSTTNHARGEEGYDTLHHVWPILNIIQRTIKEQYTLHQNFVINEATIALKGWLGFKQYMPAKSTKFGIKVWERVDATNGYIDNFHLYTGISGK